MQHRFPLSTHLEFKDALTAKNAAKESNPDGNYQIRKHHNGFKVVERLQTNEAKVIEGIRKPKKRRGSTYGV